MIVSLISNGPDYHVLIAAYNVGKHVLRSDKVG